MTDFVTFEAIEISLACMAMGNDDARNAGTDDQAADMLRRFRKLC